MSKCLFLWLLLCLSSANAQPSQDFYLDVKMNGYLFTCPDGIFFQPVDFSSKKNFSSSKDFLSSIDKRSFKILESHESIFSNVLVNVGDSLAIKSYYQDSLDKSNHKNRYTLRYFKASIQISLLFENSKINLDSLGYGFIYKDSLYYYGNFVSTNRLFYILPEKKVFIKKLYDAYISKGYSIPVLLSRMYKEHFP